MALNNADVLAVLDPPDDGGNGTEPLKTGISDLPSDFIVDAHPANLPDGFQVDSAPSASTSASPYSAIGNNELGVLGKYATGQMSAPSYALQTMANVGDTALQPVKSAISELPGYNTVAGLASAAAQPIENMTESGAQKLANAIDSPATEGIATKVANTYPEGVNDLKAIGRLMTIEPTLDMGKAGLSATADNAAATAADRVAPAKPTYDPDATHAAISDSYGAAKANAVPYYNFMRDIASGETADASSLKPALDSMITDIQNTPFHEASSELPYLKQQAAKIGDNGTMPLNDMVKLKQSLNTNFNPKRFSSGTDTPYANVGNIVDSSLNDAGKRIPEFAEAKSLADKNWLNTVINPFENNSVLQRFWKPEDYYAKSSVDSGKLEELPDATKQRAATMLDNIKNPVQLNAVRRALPEGLANNLSQAKIKNITQGSGTGRLASAGKMVMGSPNLTPSGIANTLKNAANVVKPGYTPAELDLIKAAKTPSPALSTKYAPRFQQMKAAAQQQKDMSSEMQPMDYAPAQKPMLALPAPEPYSVSGKGVTRTPMQRGSDDITEINTGATPPPVSYTPEIPRPVLALPAPKPYNVSSKGIVTTPAQVGSRAITEINKGAKPYPLSNMPEPVTPARPSVKNWENPLIPHMEGVVSELQNAANGQRYFDYSAEGQGSTPNVMSMKSQNPDWFQSYNRNNPNNTVTKKYVADTFSKMKAGESLGEKQQKVADMIRSEALGRLQEDQAQRAAAIESAKSNPDDPNHEHAIINDDIPFAKGGLVNTSPSEAQKRAGNYKKQHIRLHGMDITIENPKGSIRSGKDKGGKEWEVTMPNNYGYFKRTEGKDGDHVDVYVGDKPDVGRVYVINQLNADNGRFDEHKVMLGFPNKAEAMAQYKKAFSDGKGAQRIGSVVPMSISDLKYWLRKGDLKKRAA